MVARAPHRPAMWGIAVGALWLTGCASTILKGYVGRDVSAAIATYGPPIATFDVPDGRRAFQWEIREMQNVPDTTTYEDTDTDRGVRGQVTHMRGYQKESVCFYTLYAEPAPRGGWTVTGFEKPTFECE